MRSIYYSLFSATVLAGLCACASITETDIEPEVDPVPIVRSDAYVMALATSMDLVSEDLFSKNQNSYYLAPVKSNDLWGFVDTKGNWVIQPQFFGVVGFSFHGLAGVQALVGDSYKWGFIDRRGEWVIPPQFDRLENFAANGLARVCVADGHWGRWGFINLDGEWAIPPNSEIFARGFESNGLARAHNRDDKWGVIDASGEWVIQPQFDEIEFVPHSGITIVAVYDLANSNYMDRNINYLYGFVNAAGELIPPTFEELMDFSGTLIAAKGNFDILGLYDRWGFIDTNGEWVIPPQFESAGGFCGGDLAPAKSGGKWGFINRSGEWVIEPQFDYAMSFAQGALAPVQVDRNWRPNWGYGHNWGYIDRNGEWVFQPQFKTVQDFSDNGLALVKTDDGKWGVINIRGQWVLRPQSGIFLYKLGPQGLIRAKAEDGKWGYIDLRGKWVIRPTKFEDIGDFAAIMP